MTLPPRIPPRAATGHASPGASGPRPRAAGTARGGALLSHAAKAIRGPTEALHGLPINAELIVKGELLTLVNRFSSGL